MQNTEAANAVFQALPHQVGKLAKRLWRTPSNMVAYLINKGGLTQENAELVAGYLYEVNNPVEVSHTARFDAYEIHPVVSWLPDGEEKETAEACETWAEALNIAGQCSGKAFWTLYGHTPGEGLTAIADVDSEDAAMELLYKITGITAPKGTSGTMHTVDDAD